MITVIADDLTGAAELAGISLRYGLRTELCTGDVKDTDADVLVVSTDSRSMNKEAAVKITIDVLKQVLPLKPALVYKKIDSVLRGYVLDELEVQMQLMGKDSAFILPANPSLGRTIRNGEYFIDGKRITDTGFASDPEFPVQSSGIRSMLKDDSVAVCKTGDTLSIGIVVGEAENEKEVQVWADKIGDDRVLAGAGDFYTALLRRQHKECQKEDKQVQLPFLYVCGTAYDQSVKRVNEISGKLDAVMYINKQMILSPSSDNSAWFEQCQEKLQRCQKTVIAFEKSQIPAGSPASELRDTMAKTVKQVVERNTVRELFIEGGSTATAILDELDIKHLKPVNELKRGVVRMRAGDLYITVKPGSYELPDEIKDLFELKT
ncbi:MAG: hypothetical protein JNK14_02040 [Chitinophagaceae bacterium]|nr:hypothetical protein [Chitinophagaceae bacterium]